MRPAPRVALALLLGLAAAASPPPASAQGTGSGTGTGSGFSVKIVNPGYDDFVLGRSRLAAEVSIDQPKLIAKVEFYVDDRLIFIDKEPPYEVVHAFGDEPRAYVIRVEAQSRLGDRPSAARETVIRVSRPEPAQ